MTHVALSQLVEPVLMGVGKVDSDGLLVQGEKATGVPSFVMIKVCFMTFYRQSVEC